MEKGGAQGIRSEEEVVPKSQVKELERRVRELERILGKKTLENEILREAVKLAREKNLISWQPLPEWKISTKTNHGGITNVKI